MAGISRAVAGERLSVVDMHTAGEPVRILDVAGLVPGGSILDKRRVFRERFDHIRRALMLEPRGHPEMYGAFLTDPVTPGADVGVLFTHGEGYSTMCGHATIALGRYLHDRAGGEGPGRYRIDCPCGPVEVRVAPAARSGEPPRVEFDSVECFADSLDEAVEVPGLGRVVFDLGYGGAYYAILPAPRLGFDLATAPISDMATAARALVETLRRDRPIRHPEAEDLSFLYGAILTDDLLPGDPGVTRNLCWFADGQIDRSPTGSGVSARLAVDAARGLVREGERRRFAGPTGEAFEAWVSGTTARGVTATVSGRAFYTGTAEFVIEAADPFAEGFGLERMLPLVPS